MSETTSSRRRTGASRGLVLGTVLGAPVMLAWSWFLAAIVITALFAPWLSRVRPDLGWGAWLVAFAYAVLLFASVFLHELAHAVAGRLTGQKVAAIELNIWGGLTRFEPRIDEDSKRSAMTSFVISVVGPIVNLVLAAIGWAVLQFAEPWSVTWLILLAMTVANGALGVINLLPGIPLDGGWALQALVWRLTASQYLATIVASWVGRLIAVGFIVWSVVVPLLAGGRPELVTVLWMSAIAFMLWLSAGEAATHAKRARRMETYDLSRVIQPAIAATWDAEVGPTLDYADSVSQGQTLVVVLDREGLPYGLLDRHAASQVHLGAAGTSQVRDFARPLGAWIGVPEDITAPHLLESLTHRPKAQFCLVLSGSTLTGIIDLQEFFDELLAS
ncbi:site-2 protease family protein [Brevibacterium daeguense]|uniref:site-2 protease family protein n=1 Tax=Brevibacterium daeguense TaxID=909936 RepID=UPI001F3A28B8|nr:site-2 protease family protein [Brevibacterium daeguense]